MRILRKHTLYFVRERTPTCVHKTTFRTSISVQYIQGSILHFFSSDSIQSLLALSAENMPLNKHK